MIVFAKDCLSLCERWTLDNGSEFVNETLIQYCLSHGIELTRSRPWRKNDQAWIEQKNGAVVRKLLGYRRFQGIAAAQAITRLYGASRLFVNFFQPSFKLKEKLRVGGRTIKRYDAPQTPCARLLALPGTPAPMPRCWRKRSERSILCGCSRRSATRSSSSSASPMRA